MLMNLVVGNLISLAASVFLAMSFCASSREKAYYLQATESGLLCLSSVFFFSWAGLSTQVLSVFRNLLVAKGKLTGRLTALFTVLVVILGLAVNNRGLLGLLPVAATVQLTLCNYYLRGMKGTKAAFLINALLWIVYSFSIQDLASGASAAVVFCIGAVSLYRLCRRERLAESLA